MKMTSGKTYCEDENNTCCTIRDGKNVLTVKHGNDNDLYVTMDYYDKDDENPDKNIKFDDEFTMKMSIPRIIYPDLYKSFAKLFQSLQDHNHRIYGSQEEDEVIVYSNNVGADAANYLIIRCIPGLVELIFKTQKPKYGEKDINSSVHIPIRLFRTWSTTNLFEEFFKELPEVIRLENERTKQKSEYKPVEVNNSKGPKSYSYRNRHGKRK